MTKNRLAQPGASLYYDRLSQFISWQSGAPVTLVRRMVMRRLTNMGNLSVAVRRAWRALDQAKTAVDTAVDAEARKVLATLSSIEMLNLSRLYLSAAARCDRAMRLDLVYAAGALYGSAVLTTTEIRILKHLKLLR